jgi:hypothetical protein
MGWAIGYDPNWHRDVGYGVPCLCDHPHCIEEIDRGLAYICGNDIYGGKYGCGLFFCDKHHSHYRGKSAMLCERCAKRRKPFPPKPDLLQWTYFKMIDPSWAKWRKENGLTPQALEIDIPDFETNLGYAQKGDEDVVPSDS